MWDKFAQRFFITKLEACEAELSSLREYEQEFVTDLRRRFDARNQDAQYGVKPWEPSAKQINFLGSIADGLR